MKVAVDVLEEIRDPHLEVRHEHVLSMMLRSGSLESGARRTDVKQSTVEAGEIRLCSKNSELWIGSRDLRLLAVTISDAAMLAAYDAADGRVELQRTHSPVEDPRVAALVMAVNAERIAGFPNGRLFLDSLEQGLAVALLNEYGSQPSSPQVYRGGLSPAHLRRVTELVDSRIDGDVTLEELAQSVALSTSHFSRVFHNSTGQSPHQFVLRHRVGRAKEILRTADGRILDVAVACGFKTQQHFARVFRKICGVTPTEYRRKFSW